MSETTTATAVEVSTESPSLVHVDPAALLLATNVRTDARLDKAFLASVRERGVLVPVVAHRREDGALAVLMGQRRTLAAVETARPTIPVLVVDDLAEADRLVDQMGENDHRAALTTGERVAAFAQLSALGVSAAQIAKRTATKRTDVDAALTVAASDVATGAADRWDFLTLDQSASLADFESDPETITALVVAARDGQFDHVAQRARDARALRQAREQAAADLAATGVRVIERPAWNEPARALGMLTHDGEDITVESHAQCPGHAAYLDLRVQWVHDEETDDQASDVEDTTSEDDIEDEDGDHWDNDEDQDEDDEPGDFHRPTRQVETLVPRYVCTDPGEHGHADRYSSTYGHGTERPRAADMSETEREQAKAERRDVIESNRAWASAETVRRDWLRQFATRKSAPKDAPQFIAATLVDGWALAKANETGHPIACDLLGVEGGTYGRRPTLVDDKTTGPRAQVLTLVLLLAAAEQMTGKHSWRNVSASTTTYLRWIEAQGYALSDVERRACGEDPLPVEAETPEAGHDVEDEDEPGTD